jgi:hypothetical protein
VFHRYFYALDTDQYIQTVTSNCPQCAALATLPQEVTKFSTSSAPPTGPGISFACDVMRRAKQKVLVLRDYFSSYTKAILISSEDKAVLRDALVEISADIKISSGVTIRVDGAPAFQALVDDPTLTRHGLSLVIGRLKNINKNPVGEKAVQELEAEMKKAFPEGGPISPSSLAVVVATLNSRIRNRGLSAKEILFQRDNDSLSQLNLSDMSLSDQQLHHRTQNHLASAISKAPKGVPPHSPTFSVGDLVFVKSEGTKHTGRERYIVSSCTQDAVIIKKLVGAQFRAKEYAVQPSEIYLVPFGTIAHPGYPMKDTDPYNSSDTDEEYDHKNEPVHDHESDHNGPMYDHESGHGSESHYNLLESDNELNQESDLNNGSLQGSHSDSALPAEDLNVSDVECSSPSSSEDEGDPVSDARPKIPPAWMRSGDWDFG